MTYISAFYVGVLAGFVGHFFAGMQGWILMMCLTLLIFSLELMFDTYGKRKQWMK